MFVKVSYLEVGLSCRQCLVENVILDAKALPQVPKDERAVFFELELARHVVAVEIGVLY